jgi:tRNA-Thr(GGU) m(6)t(6)A37 methyltransferase TsaA
VHNDVAQPSPHGWEKVNSELRLDESLEPGLDGIDGFSHLIVVFWLHLIPDEKRTAGPQEDFPIAATFATRTPVRPNPLGVSVVEFLGREGPVLRVRGLDAVDGTPLLDIKPYLPPYDARPDAKMPKWVYG